MGNLRYNQNSNNTRTALSILDVEAMKTYTFNLPTSVILTDGKTYDLTIYANNGLMIDKFKTVSSHGEIEYYEHNCMMLRVTMVKEGIDLDVYTATYVPPPPPPEEPTKKGVVTLDNENILVTIHDSWNDETYEIVYGEPFDLMGVSDSLYTVTVTTKEGYFLSTVKGGKVGFKDFTINDDNTVATYKGLILDDFNIIAVTYTDEAPIYEGVVGFNYLYLIDKENLFNLSKERFVTLNGSQPEIIDIGKYIINVIEFPFPIYDFLKGEYERVSLGEYLLDKARGVFLLSDEIHLNVGKITVPSKYHNSYDYLNTTIYLHLPFSKKIELDTDYVINETISIIYIVNLYSGETNVNITSSKLNGGVFHNELIKIGKNIPFINKEGEVIGSISNKNGVNNGVYNAFIEVVRNKPFELNNPFNDDMLVQTKLINESGYVKVNNIMLNSSATSPEKDTIESMLRNGVYIK